MKDLCLVGNAMWAEVLIENKRQLDKWGRQDRTPFEWLAFVTEELGELSEAISEHHFREGLCESVVKEAIQVATLALKIAEMYQALLVRRLAP